MSLPLFPSGSDPGPSFVELLRRTRHEEVQAPAAALADMVATAGRHLSGLVPTSLPPVVHGTTIVALRYDNGVVVAGDRRATEGNMIAHRSIEKVFPADRYSAVAISGAAGAAVEMVRLFQTQLEHYEKVEGSTLSLEGKANQLGQMVSANLQMAMQGLVVIPLFAGYDLRLKKGRIFTYDVTGGRFEETDFHATGSGGRDAKNTVKLSFRERLGRDEAVDLAVNSLYEAADEDTATGGPDPLRGIYPVVATVDSEGYRRLEDPEVAEHFRHILQRRSERDEGGVPS
ncbi:MAG: proteasome subunit beta [Acidimicrobiales bacterium]|jgi:proteasome beta subunit